MDDLSQLRIDRGGKASNNKTRNTGSRLWLTLGVICLAVIIGYVGFSFLLMPSTDGMKITHVKQAYPYQFFTLLIASGYVVPRMQADVATKATGRLDWLGVEEGARVTKGQLIARLDNQDVLALKEKATADVQIARARLSEAQAELRDAKRSLDRVDNLMKKNVVTKEVYDSATARHEKAVASAESFAAAVASAEAALYGASVEVDSTLIRAPFDGVVLSKYANIGDVVAPFSSTIESKGAVLSMADLDTLEVEVDVAESELHKVLPEQPCVIELDALPNSRFRCTVSGIVPTVDKTKGTVLVKATFVDKDKRILPNMTARIAFLSQASTASDMQAIRVVPATSILQRGDDQVLLVVKDGNAVPVEVRTGTSFGDSLQLLTDLAVGTPLILEPHLISGKRHGQTVAQRREPASASKMP